MMKEMFKRQYKKALLALVYIIMALLVYNIWFDAMWHLWYVNVITSIVIVALGVVIGYFWIKAEDEKTLKESQSKTEEKTEAQESKPVENNQ